MSRNVHVYKALHELYEGSYCDLKGSSSQAKIDEHVADYFLKPKLKTSAL